MSNRSRNKGYLMLEVVASIAVIAIGLVMILRSFSYSLRASKTAQEYFEAVNIAEQELCAIEVEEKIEGGVIVSESSAQVEDKPFLMRSKVSRISDDDGLNEASVVVNWKNKHRDESVVAGTYVKNR